MVCLLLIRDTAPMGMRLTGNNRTWQFQPCIGTAASQQKGMLKLLIYSHTPWCSQNLPAYSHAPWCSQKLPAYSHAPWCSQKLPASSGLMISYITGLFILHPGVTCWQNAWVLDGRWLLDTWSSLSLLMGPKLNVFNRAVFHINIPTVF